MARVGVFVWYWFEGQVSFERIFQILKGSALFNGFSPELFAFLRDLKAHNSKEWFDQNRTTYETHFKIAAQDFIAEISGRMAALTPPLQAVPKVNGSLRRINRDIRFAKDKSPYHDHMHLIFWAGDHPNRAPGMHFVLKGDGIGYGAGFYGMSPKALTRYRMAVCDEAQRAELESAIDTAEKVDSTLEPPELVRVPRGMSHFGPEMEFLKHKSIVVRTHTDAPLGEWLYDGEAVCDRFAILTQAHMPLIAWLARLNTEEGASPDFPR